MFSQLAKLYAKKMLKFCYRNANDEFPRTREIVAPNRKIQSLRKTRISAQKSNAL